MSQAYQQLPQRLGPGDCPWRLGAAEEDGSRGGGAVVAWNCRCCSLIQSTSPQAFRDKSRTLTNVPFFRDNLKEAYFSF